MENVIGDIKEKAKSYIDSLEKIMNELECEDCKDKDKHKICRFCRLEILSDLADNLERLIE